MIPQQIGAFIDLSRSRQPVASGEDVADQPNGWPDCQAGTAQLGLLERQFDDLVVDVRRDPVPHPARRRRPIFQRFRPAFEIAVIPTVEGPARNAQLIEGPLRREVRRLDDPDDLKLFGCGIPHSPCYPAALLGQRKDPDHP